MKHLLISAALLLTVCQSLAGVSKVIAPQDTSDLAKGFSAPPQSARPYVWWHWMDGNVSIEGIRKDLEWMHRAGIGGFQQFDAGGINMPRAAKVRLPYMSEGWKEAFRFALHLADSLGMEAGIASAPGWSSTGGPWVSPDDAMKKLEWRSADVKGGKGRVKLPALYKVTGPFQDYEVGNDRIEVKPFGHDLFVIAVKKSPEDLSMSEMGAVLNVSDTVITCRFGKARTIKAFTLESFATGGGLKGGDPEYKNILECSDDGITWKEILKILPSRLPYITGDFTPAKARFFRVRGEKLVSLELYSVTKVNRFEELAGYCTAFDLNGFHTPDTGDAVSSKDVIDLTGKMAPDGTLEYSLPSGRWRIYRFGTSITGKVNHPSSPEATGLEVDKLNPDAWMRYFRKYVEVYKEAAGGMLGQKGIRYLLVDSYEAGSMTWTPDMISEFRKRRGYDLIPWLPALAGEVVGSAEESEGFLWDWRKTLAELFEENYNRINEIVKEYDLSGRYTESHEGGRAFIGDGMEVKRTAAVPMAAIWMEDTPNGSRIPSAIADIKESASVSHIFGQNLVAAESFTVDGSKGHAYTYCPENMKYVADIALSSGLNRFVIHESASQPNDDYLPGMQLFGYGQWFHRNETWSGYARPFTDYLARSCFMLQQGHAVSDILLYYGEDSNVTAQYGGDSFDLLPQIPEGHEYDFASPYVLLHSVRPENGGLATETGMRYKVLWIGESCKTMSLEVLRRIAELADSGTVICGKAPVHCAGLLGDTKEFDTLVSHIWKSGKRNVVQDLGKAISLADARPDFIARYSGKTLGDGKEVRYIHRHTSDGSEIYWVRNFTGKDIEAALSFRDGGTYAAMFNPENGRIENIPASSTEGRTEVKARMKATDAMFLVFSASPFRNASDDLKDYAAISEDSFKTLQEIDARWNVHFSQKGGGTADEVFPALVSWTEKSDPVVKYFSGTAVYSTEFSVNPDELSGTGKMVLDLGNVKNIAEVSINGESAGVLWKAPFRTEDIRSYLRSGKNTLEIKVTNVWRNRMTGDVQKGETHPVTAVRRFSKAGDPLLPSGLLGPVRLLLGN